MVRGRASGISILPTEKKNIVKFAVFCVVMVLCGMAFGWFLLHLMSYR